MDKLKFGLCLLGIFILKSFVGCTSNDIVVERYPNGKPKLINCYVNKGAGHFIQKEFDENGILNRQRTFVNFKEEGFEYGFYSTGEKATEVMYHVGKRNGITHEFHKNGQIRFEGIYYPDSGFCGLSTHYYVTGELASRGVRRNSEYIGVWKEYYRNGILKRIVDYDSRKRDRYYDSAGNPITKERYEEMKME